MGENRDLLKEVGRFYLCYWRESSRDHKDDLGSGTFSLSLFLMRRDYRSWVCLVQREDRGNLIL